MWSVLQISSALPFGPYQKRMHSHVVPILFRSALPFGPFRYQECTPMWSLLIFGVHSHMVRITFKNALRSSPPPFSNSNAKYNSLFFFNGHPMCLSLCLCCLALQLICYKSKSSRFISLLIHYQSAVLKKSSKYQVISKLNFTLPFFKASWWN